MGKKSFKILINTKKELNPNIYKLLEELTPFVQIENGQFVYDEKDEDEIKNLLNKYFSNTKK